MKRQRNAPPQPARAHRASADRGSEYSSNHGPDRDYYPAALALWPRLVPPRDAAVRHDAARMAAHVARRTAAPVATVRAVLA